MSNVDPFVNDRGESVFGRNGYAGKAPKYNLCQLGCAYASQVPEGCQILKALQAIERVHHTKVVVWECPQYMVAK